MCKTKKSESSSQNTKIRTLFLTYNLCSKAYFKTACVHPSCQSCAPASFFFFFLLSPTSLQDQIQKRASQWSVCNNMPETATLPLHEERNHGFDQTHGESRTH